MAIIRLNPWLFPRQTLPSLFENEEWPELTVTEGLDVYEEDGNVVVKASVPGIPEEKLDITYEDGVLHVTGKTEEKEEEKKKNRIVHRMQRVTSFNYTTYLPRPIDEKKIEATVKDGVLTVRAPLAEAAKPKKITVKALGK